MKHHCWQHYLKHLLNIIHIEIKNLLSLEEDLVLQNLYENKFINQIDYLKFKKQPIELKK